MTDHVNFLLLGLANGAVFATLALAVVVTFRSSGVLNFATGAIALQGAYTYAYLRRGLLLNPIPPFPGHAGSRPEPWPRAGVGHHAPAPSGVGRCPVPRRLPLPPQRGRSHQSRRVAGRDGGPHRGARQADRTRAGARRADLPVAHLPARGRAPGRRPPRRRAGGTWCRVAARRDVPLHAVRSRDPRRVGDGDRRAASPACRPSGWPSSTGPSGPSSPGSPASSSPLLTPLVPGTYTLFIVPALAAAVLGRFSALGSAVVGGLVIGMLQSEAVFLGGRWSFVPKSGSGGAHSARPGARCAHDSQHAATDARHAARPGARESAPDPPGCSSRRLPVPSSVRSPCSRCTAHSAEA